MLTAKRAQMLLYGRLHGYWSVANQAITPNHCEPARTEALCSGNINPSILVHMLWQFKQQDGARTTSYALHKAALLAADPQPAPLEEKAPATRPDCVAPKPVTSPPARAPAKTKTWKAKEVWVGATKGTHIRSRPTSKPGAMAEGHVFDSDELVVMPWDESDRGSAAHADDAMTSSFTAGSARESQRGAWATHVTVNFGEPSAAALSGAGQPVCESAAYALSEPVSPDAAAQCSVLPRPPLLDADGSEEVYPGWNVEQERQLVLLSYRIMDQLGTRLIPWPRAACGGRSQHAEACVARH